VVSYFLRYFSSPSTEQISSIPPDKADALQRLAMLVETILNPPERTNVVDLAVRR
jgi:hypothetical protein